MKRSQLLRCDAAAGVQVSCEQTGEGNGCPLDRHGSFFFTDPELRSAVL
jgi:hypothetical protein